MSWIRIAAKSDLPGEGQAKEFIFPVGDRVVCIANVAGEYSAMDNVCIHRGGPLGQGVVEHGKVICPWHGWQYDPKTGEVGHNSGLKIAVYPLRIEGEEVFIEANSN